LFLFFKSLNVSSFKSEPRRGIKSESSYGQCCDLADKQLIPKCRTRSRTIPQEQTHRWIAHHITFENNEWCYILHDVRQSKSRNSNGNSSTLGTPKSDWDKSRIFASFSSRIMRRFHRVGRILDQQPFSNVCFVDPFVITVSIWYRFRLIE
jgi:hypothetical protein